MTMLEALIIQFKFAIFMIVANFIWAVIKNQTVKEFMQLDIYPIEGKLLLFGFLFILWFGVGTYMRYIADLPLWGVVGYFW